MRTEIRHPEYLRVHMHQATYRPRDRESGHGWALVLLAIVFGIGIAVGIAA